MENLGNLNKPLTPSILANPYHKITKHLVYIYSMESFIYQDLNRACREKDTSQIQYFGAYAAALSYIIFGANQNRKDKLKNDNKLYRGLKLPQADIESFNKGEIINLQGYTSTSKNFKVALAFSLEEPIEGHVAVVYEINFHGSKGLFEMSKGYSSFSEEQEVLI